MASIATLLKTFNPQTRLVMDATGIWTSGYYMVEWAQVASFYATESTGTAETTAYLVFTTYASQQIKVSMDAVDTDFEYY